MAAYRFLTTWLLEAPREQVWDAWRVYEGELGTASTWEWRVATTERWMNALGSLAKPAFAWNHHRIMRWGGEGLARRLGVRLLATG